MHVLLLLSVSIHFSYCSKSAKMVELIDNILQNKTISIRPGLDNNITTVINISFSLVALTSLNEVKGYMSTIGFYDITWRNDKVSWNPADYEGIDDITINSEKLWKPELLVANPAEEIYIFREIFTKVKYHSDGTAHWKPGSIMKTYCYIQIPSYPFDEHICYINVMSWGTSSVEVILTTPTDNVFVNLYNENTEWTLTKTSASTFTAGDKLPMATFAMSFSRKPVFLIVNVLIPIVCLSILNSIVFLLPHESGERVSFSVTVLLSFTVFLNVIGDNIPKTSSPTPFVCYYVILVFIFGCLITLLAILCQRLYLTCGQELAPKWLLSCLFIRFTNKVTKSSMNGEKKDLGEASHIDMEETVCSWKQIILRLDKMLFLVFFTLAIFVALAFIVTMVTMPTPYKSGVY